MSDDSALNAEQAARAEALERAGFVLAPSTSGGGLGAPPAAAVEALAEYIVTGRRQYAPRPVRVPPLGELPTRSTSDLMRALRAAAASTRRIPNT